MLEFRAVSQGADVANTTVMEQISITISLNETEADVLKEVLSAKLTDLRREISHTDSPRFRNTLYEVDAVLERVLAQLPTASTA